MAVFSYVWMDWMKGIGLIYMESSKERKVLYYSLLNICATFCVVWLHFNNEIHWYTPTLAWRQSVVVQVLAFWAIPIFFMLSGATLINYRSRYSTKQFFKKRIQKVFVPFLIWGTVFAFWRMQRGELTLIYNNILELQWAIVNMFVNNQMEPIYWLFPALFAIYLSMPALTCFIEEKNRPVLRYILVVGTATISIIPFSYNLICTLLNNGVGWWNSLWQLPVLGGYLLFPLLGYWASTHNFKYTERVICYILAIIFSVIRIAGIFYLFPRDGQKPEILFDYLSLPSVLLALAVFVFFKQCRWEKLKGNDKLCSFIYKLSECSLGIYLIHLIFLNEIGKISILSLNTNIWHFIAPIICYIFCAFVVYVLRSIPFLRLLF